MFVQLHPFMMTQEIFFGDSRFKKISLQRLKRRKNRPVSDKQQGIAEIHIHSLCIRL